MGEGRRLGGLPISELATCALAFALIVCTAPLLASAALLAQVAAYALEALLAIVGNLSDANLVATENAEQYARCLDWLHAHRSRIALKMDGLSIGMLASLRLVEAGMAKPAEQRFAPSRVFSRATHRGALVT